MIDMIMIERHSTEHDLTIRIIRHKHTYFVQKEIKFHIFGLCMCFWITIKKFIGYDLESGDFARLEAFELLDNLLPLEDKTIWQILK